MDMIRRIGLPTLLASLAVLEGYRINLSASLEPDADHDGYGDETQDCPTNAATVGLRAAERKRERKETQCDITTARTQARPI